MEQMIDLFQKCVMTAAKDTRKVPRFMNAVFTNADVIVPAFVSAIARHAGKRGSMEIHPVVNAIAKVVARAGVADGREASVTIATNIVWLFQKMGWVSIRVTPEITMISMTAKFLDIMRDKWHLAGCLNPVSFDCPVAHTPTRPGGYRDRRLRIGMSNGSWRCMRDAEPALLAGNRMQRVKYRVNRSVLKIAKRVLDTPLAVAHRDRFAHDTVLAVADNIPKNTSFYLPTYFEGSGRIFYAPVLNPQGNDLARGLLRFSKSVTLTDEGWKWLKVHIANSFSGVGGVKKIDKLPFDQRVKWVDENSEMLKKVAEDPEGSIKMWWDGLKKGAQSFQALAAALAYARALKTGKCNLPVMLDQTTSNYGHAAAMLRDPELAKWTNLSSTDKIEDFHSEVVGKLRIRIGKSGLKKHGKILLDRKVVKGPSMIAGYGGTPRGSAISLLGRREWAECEDGRWVKVAETGSLPARMSDDPRKQFKFALEAANAIQASVIDVAKSAFTITNLVRQCVKKMKDTASDPCFISPTGVRVRVTNKKVVEKRVGVSEVLGGGSIKWHFYSDEYNWRKIMTAFAPRFTHAHDASALHLTINACDFPVVGVHDCFGCHPNHMGELYDNFRNAMVKIHGSKTLKKFCETWDVPVTLGKFKIEKIKKGLMLS